MKKTILTLLGGVLLVSGSMKAQEIQLNDLKINARLEDRERIKTFYSEVLGAEVGTPEDQTLKRDYVQFTNEQRLNYLYFDDPEQAPGVEEVARGIWIKIKVDEFDAIRQRLLKSDAEIIREKPDQGELYFQAPGGLVFRMVDGKQQE